MQYEYLQICVQNLAMRTERTKAAFTLIEMLIAVTIVMVLIALLLPAIKKAKMTAYRAICLSNQRTIVTGLHQYATEYNSYFPPYDMNGYQASAYDLRGSWWTDTNTPKRPRGLGLLAQVSLLPTTKLGKIIHCPAMDNTGSGHARYGMDRIWHTGTGVGGSWWTNSDYANMRVIGSYNYRASSWLAYHNVDMTTADANGTEVMIIDLPDMRFGGKFLHPDGYNRAFGNGHGAWFADPERKVDNLIMSYPEYFGSAGAVHGLLNTAPGEERHLYPFLAVQR